MEQILFAPGDKGVCVDSHSSFQAFRKTSDQLIEGKVYTIHEVYRCKCGVVFVKVGIPSYSTFEICVCGDRANSNGISSHRQTRFAPVDAIENIEEQIFEALKGIPETL